MLGKKIEPLTDESKAGLESIFNSANHLEGWGSLNRLHDKVNEIIEDYMRFKNLLEQKLLEIQTNLTETNMQIAHIAAASGSKSLVEDNYERPPVDDFEKEFGKIQTTDEKANLGPTKAPKFEEDDPFG